MRMIQGDHLCAGVILCLVHFSNMNQIEYLLHLPHFSFPTFNLHQVVYWIDLIIRHRACINVQEVYSLLLVLTQIRFLYHRAQDPSIVYSSCSLSFHPSCSTTVIIHLFFTDLFNNLLSCPSKCTLLQHHLFI